ncbi:MAG TPA: hypothetical protein VMH87_16645 [Pseudomonadales bacterium]|nr:hypothetical protein [Pseudomonadales bacterium]
MRYEHFPLLKSLPGAVCIFIDLEMLEPDELSLATRLSRALHARPETYTVFNEPRRYPGRFNLLKMLHASGINEFQARYIDKLNGDIKFPVFLRNELDHDGPISPLLHSPYELEHALTDPALRKPSLRKHLIAVEFCDCSENGVFRKYSAMKIGDKIVPRHVLFSEKWATKKPDIISKKTADEEMEFVTNFPHADQVLKVFEIAGLDYGRIDYGLHHGRIQVWEINTNPIIVPSRKRMDPQRMPAQSESAQRIAGAMVALSKRYKDRKAHPFRTKSFFMLKAVQTIKKVPHVSKRFLKSVKKRLD